MKHRKSWKQTQCSVQALQAHRQQNFRLCPLALALCGALSLGVAQAQETFTYDGSNPGLRKTIDSVANSLGPANLNNRTGNTITIDYTTIPSNRIGGSVYGSHGMVDASSNRIVMRQGEVGSFVLGSLVAGSGNAINNHVTISGTASVNQFVVGGHTHGGSGNANDNSVTVYGGSVGRAINAGFSNNGTANNNKANISGGTVGGIVAGGYSNSGIVSNNTTTVTGGKVSGAYVSGGSSISGAVSNNTTTISAGTVTDLAVGGVSNTGAAAYNSVTISGTASVGMSVYGGQTANGSATVNNNTATISGGTVDGAVMGGISGGSGTVSNNTTAVTGGRVGKNVFGGFSSGSGTVSNNNTTVSAGTVLGSASGGHSKTGAVKNNTTTVSGGTVYGAVSGGQNQSNAGTVTDNRVFISGTAEIKNFSVFGGHTFSTFGIDVNNHTTATANHNTVTVSGNSAVRKGSVIGGFAQTHVANSTASHNTVTVSDNIYVRSDITGGQARSSAANYSASANNNTVNFHGGSLDSYIYGGDAQTIGAKNPAIASGGTAKWQVYGGSAWTSGADSPATASGNTVNISGGTVEGYIFGGYVTTESANSPCSATNNTVSISGAPTFSANPNPRYHDTTNPIHGRVIFGGHGNTEGTSDLRTGNTLQMRTTGIAVNNIANFENLHFYLPHTITNGATVLTLTNAGASAITDSVDPADDRPDIPAGADISNTRIGVAIAGNSSTLKAGDRVTLIHTSGGNLTTDATLSNNVTGMQGISTLYEFSLSTDPNHLFANITKAGINPQTKSLLEGNLGGLAFLKQGADYLAQEGMNKAAEAANSGTAVFGGIHAGNVKHKTGSHVDVSGINLLVGVAGNIKNTAGNFTLGGFIEAGDGDYDSFNSFVDADPVNGGGDNRYYGVGLLGRQTFANNVYAEGSIRAGKLEHDFHAFYAGEQASYDQSRTYYGAHLGLGYKQTLGKGELDTYAQGLWTRQKGGSFDILGDPYRVSDIDSTRARLGLRYAYAVNPDWLLKTGASWEYEFDGKAQGSVHGFQITRPELKGSSGTLELGMSYRPQQSKKFSLDVGLQGHVGKREGVTGNITMKYAF